MKIILRTRKNTEDKIGIFEKEITEEDYKRILSFLKEIKLSIDGMDVIDSNYSSVDNNLIINLGSWNGSSGRKTNNIRELGYSLIETVERRPFIR